MDQLREKIGAFTEAALNGNDLEVQVNVYELIRELLKMISDALEIASEAHECTHDYYKRLWLDFECAKETMNYLLKYLVKELRSTETRNDFEMKNKARRNQRRNRARKNNRRNRKN